MASRRMKMLAAGESCSPMLADDSSKGRGGIRGGRINWKFVKEWRDGILWGTIAGRKE